MEDYWAKTETKLRKLVYELLEPTIRRVSEYTEITDSNQNSIDSLMRRMETNDIVIDRINSKLEIIDEFSKKLIQFNSDLRLSEHKSEIERDKIMSYIELINTDVVNNKENISVLNGQMVTAINENSLLAVDINATKANLSEKIDSLKNEYESNLASVLDKQKILELSIYNTDKKCNSFLNALEEINVVSQKASYAVSTLTEQINKLEQELTTYKKTSKDQIEKARLLAIQYSHQSSENIKKLKIQYQTEIPIQTHLQISEFLYNTTDDLKLSKQIAEYDSKVISDWDAANIPFEILERIQESKLKIQNIIDTPLPEVKAKPARKKKKFNLNDMLSFNNTSNSKQSDDKDYTDRSNIKDPLDKNFAKNPGKGYLKDLDENYSDQSNEDPQSGSEKSFNGLEMIKQNAEALAKLMGVKDYTQDIENLRLTIDNNLEAFQVFTEEYKNTVSALKDQIETIFMRINTLEDYQNVIRNKFLRINEDFMDVNKKIDGNSNDIKSIYKYIQITKDEIIAETNKIDKKFEQYIESTSKTVKDLEIKVNQAVFEVGNASTQRKRDQNDYNSEFQKLNGMADNIIKQQENFSKKFEYINKSINLITEFSRINTCLQYQDELDRESIALFGYKDTKIPSKTPIRSSISLNKQCISCSGQVKMITSAFKIACLAYTPSPVIFRDCNFQRIELLEIQKKMVEGLSDEITTNESTIDRYRVSKTPKPHWRPPSSLSMCIPSVVPNTPDLPPISLSKRVNNY